MESPEKKKEDRVRNKVRSFARSFSQYLQLSLQAAVLVCFTSVLLFLTCRTFYLGFLTFCVWLLVDSIDISLQKCSVSLFWCDVVHHVNMSICWKKLARVLTPPSPTPFHSCPMKQLSDRYSTISGGGVLIGCSQAADTLDSDSRATHFISWYLL